ncbi:carbohydrate ABC transporter permease [Clostridium thermarum]|uniref:carbohydrate ABC transporter permease n=1 Tax=Clostridium thermarum TaxID=1716543 RepID=UPI0013D316EA|nr:carbohydrate ABC transporter permease [Clostridium thermarum]
MNVIVKRKTNIVNIILFVILSLGAITMIFPLFWMISTSLKESQYVFKIPPQWIPNPIVWSKYTEVWKLTPLLKGIKNSMIIAVTVITFGMFNSSLAAFAFSKLKFPYKNQLFLTLLGTMMIPYAVILIPQFVAFSKIGWFDTLLPLIVPGLFGSVGVLFFLRQYMNGIPNELIEAAKIDGCSYFGIYARIMMPLSKPALSAQVIFMFMGIWNDFFGPIIYINTPEKMTIQAMISNFNSLYQSQTDFPLIMAASLISMAPILILFIIFQNYFVESLAISGIKG